jgi:hypothetical protein
MKHPWEQRDRLILALGWACVVSVLALAAVLFYIAHR